MTNVQSAGPVFSSTIPLELEKEGFAPGAAVSTTVPSDELSVVVIDEDEARESYLIKEISSLTESSAPVEEVLDAYGQLARHYAGREQMGKAEAMHLRSLDAAKRAYGENHPAVAHILIELAFVNYSRSDYERAKLYLESALVIQEAEYGRVSDQAAFVIHKLGRVHEALGDSNVAEEHYRRSLTIYRNTYNEDDSQMIIARNDLARIQKCKV